MGEPATAIGLALAVAPLFISALENYQNVIQPFIIFKKKYKDEVQKIQDILQVQSRLFENECGYLLDGIGGLGSEMVGNHHHWRWSHPEFEINFKTRLDNNFDACVSAVRRVCTILKEMLDETKTLEILQQKKVSSKHSRRSTRGYCKTLRRYNFRFCKTNSERGPRLTSSLWPDIQLLALQSLIWD